MFGIQDEHVEESLSREEIRSMLEDSREKGVLDEAAAEMMDRVFAFDQILANEIMTPRTQVFCIDIDEMCIRDSIYDYFFLTLCM